MSETQMTGDQLPHLRLASTPLIPNVLDKTPRLRLLVGVTMIMAAGWGIRGAFGHSRGAMMPGAMLGLSLAACSMREDWWRRGAVIGFLCAIGWGFGGTSSYGLLIGYSQGGSLLNSVYGYTGLFIVGALYSGIGAALLALGLTAPRSLLDRFLWPIILIYLSWLLLDCVEWKGWNATAWSLETFAQDQTRPKEETLWLYDTLWLHTAVALVLGIMFWVCVPRWREAASLVVLLSSAWFLSMFLLIRTLGLRINPSRGDAWAGCLGLVLAFLGWYARRRNRAAVRLILYGLLAGGLGFVGGEFIQALGKAKWGPIGHYPILQEFGYWTVMEQTFGGVMGFGIALAVLRLMRGHLDVPDEDSPGSWFNEFSVFILLGVMFAFNFRTNFFSFWIKSEELPKLILGLPAGQILSGVAVMILLLLAVALYRQRKGYLDIAPQTAHGKIQLLALLIIWMVMAIYIMLPRIGLPTSLMFFAELGIGTLMILLSGKTPVTVYPERAKNAESLTWAVGWKHLALWALVPLIIGGLAWTTLKLEIPVKQIRFPGFAPAATPPG